MTEGIPWFVGNGGIEAYYKEQPSFVALDWETTNLQYGDPTNQENDIVLGCWYVVRDGTVTKKHKFGNEFEYQELLDDIASTDFIVAHNSQFELGWLSRCGLDLHDVLVWDTMTMEWVIHGNQIVPFNLEATAQRYGFDGKESLVSKLIKNKVCPSTIPRSWLLAYCYMDVELTYQLFFKQRERIQQLSLEAIALSRNLVIPVLTDLTDNGLELDQQRVYDEYERQSQVVEELGERLDEVTGGINLNSPKQLAKLLYEDLGFTKIRDRKGNEISSTAEPVLVQLKPETEEQRKFLEYYFEYNKANTLLSKTLTYLKGVCDHMDGKFYGRIVQCRTKTHRLAGGGIKTIFPGEKKEVGIQLQNLPRQYKNLFTSHDEDYVVVEADGAGMEFRIATIIGRDEQGEYDIVHGTDVHAFTRDTMNAAYEKFGIKKVIDRQEAKSSTFTPLFWGRGKDKAEQEYAEAFAKKYSGIRAEQQRWINRVADKKELVTPYGMRFYWPTASMQRSGWVTFTNEIVNVPIQGLATAEMVPIALVHFWHRTRHLSVELFNTVHDSIIYRAHKDHLEQVNEAAKLAMTTDVYRFLDEVYGYDTGSCPLGVGFKIGTHWGESDEEIIFDVWKDGNERKTVERRKKKEVIYDTRQQEN